MKCFIYLRFTIDFIKPKLFNRYKRFQVYTIIYVYKTVKVKIIVIE